MQLKFTKMHGIGNDFIVLDGINQQITLTSEDITQLAQRHTGIGFDQCLIIEPSSKANVDFNYRIYNADGQEVGQCGNGARCLALFAKHYGLTDKNNITVATKTTQMNLRINPNNTVSVNMGQPKLKPQDIPFIQAQEEILYPVPLKDGRTINIHTINVGNPHAVLIVPNVDSAPVASLGAEISEHELFPEQTNVGFMHIVSPNHIQLRVYERGCAETQACGSGAVAAAAIGRLFHGLAPQIQVSLLGGDLIIDWPDTNGPISLTGPATFVYEGHIL